MSASAEDRADRLQRRRWGVVDRTTLLWAGLRFNVATSDLYRALGFKAMAQRHWLLPWIWAAFLILSFDALVGVTAAVLDQVCGGPCLELANA